MPKGIAIFAFPVAVGRWYHCRMNAVSRFEGIELIRLWAAFFDAHAAPEIVYGHTSGEDFEICSGAMKLVGLPGLREHDGLKSQFFDEGHYYYNFQVESDGPPLVMTSEMVWDTFRRRSDGGAEHLLADVRHRWTFVRSPETGEPVFRRHDLISLNYRDGFSPTETDSGTLHIDPERVGFGR